ncbi:MAG: MFS transporter [Rhodanobacteraceae bacterium]
MKKRNVVAAAQPKPNDSALARDDAARTPAAWIAFAIGSAFFLFEFVTRVEPSLATHAIRTFYHLTEAGFGSLSSLFFWVYAPMQIVVGLMLDRYGARRFVILGSSLCALGVLVFTAGDATVIGGIGRALTGLGASFAFVGALWLVNHWFAPQRFALLSGAVNAVGMLGTAIGGVVLSGLIVRLGWRSVFFGTGAVGLLIALTAWWFLREPPFPASNADSSATQHARQGLMRIVGNSRIWIVALIGMLYYMPVNVYGGLWGTTEMIDDHHLSAVSAQTVISMIFWGMAAGSVAGGWLSDMLGHRKWLVFCGAVLSGLAYAAAIYLPMPAFTEGVLLFAAGLFGGMQMLTFAMAKEAIANDLAGTAVAFVNMIGITGALLFQPLVGAIADRSGGNFAIALATIPASLTLAALIVLFLPEYRHPDHEPEPHAH